MASYPSINSSLATKGYNLSPKAGRKVNHIVIHYTANPASAANHCKYFAGGNRNSSADYFIDKDGSIYQYNADPKNFYSWHCGDGMGRYGITNPASIGIEMISGGEEFTQQQKDALKALVPALMSDYGVPAANVVRHWDASRKSCPLAYCGSTAKDAKWNELKAYITNGQEVPEVITDQDVDKIARKAAQMIADWMVPMDGTPGYKDQPAWMHWSWAHSDGAHNRETLDKVHAEIHNVYDKVSGQDEVVNKLHSELHTTYDVLDKQYKVLKAQNEVITKLHTELHNTYDFINTLKEAIEKK